MTFADDFGPEMAQLVLIQPWTGNDGYQDTYGEGTNYSCAIQYKNINIMGQDGLTLSTAQIYLDGAVVVAARDKITFNLLSPAILKVQPDYDIENPDEVYGTVIFT